MAIEEYLNTLTEQIRCKQAREAVREEVEGHIQDQIEECLQEGMTKEEAEVYAVKQMGDPVEAGVSLDRVHRPKVVWSMLALIGVLSILGTGVQYLISINSENTIGFNLSSHLVYTLAGFLVMALMYYLDYSFFGSYGKVMAIIFLGYMFLQVFFMGLEVNGARIFSGLLGGVTLSLRMLMLLYVPIYGGVLYSYRDGSYKEVIKAMIFLLIPLWITKNMPCLSLTLALFLTMMIMLSVAVLKGWFAVKGKALVVTAWSAIIVCPVLVLFFGIKFRWFADYQIARLESLIGGGDPKGSSYVHYRVREIIGSSRLWGKSEDLQDTSFMLPEMGSNFILTHLISYYGILVAVIIGALLLILVSKILKISFRQKNQLGMMIGLGCGSIFGIQIISYLLENLGLMHYTFVYLPLFSTGGTGIIVTYALLGIVLSIYKYQDIPLKVKRRNITIRI
ncbi:MAG: FtsW/RodA/SpoVE family cell cycle protein [Lachnospiraceae bacterium]|nr:FtsW/RodA/SpoVE family cell cycle protein [Lachnospiraceae bacterium]